MKPSTHKPLVTKTGIKSSDKASDRTSDKSNEKASDKSIVKLPSKLAHKPTPKPMEKPIPTKNSVKRDPKNEKPRDKKSSIVDPSTLTMDMKDRNFVIPPDKLAQQVLDHPKSDDFEILQNLGQGFYTSVVTAYHRPSDSFLAIKIYDAREEERKSRISLEEKVRLARDEKVMLRDLHSPFKAKFLGTCRDSSCTVLLLMEYIPGQSLQKLIARSRGFSNLVAKFYFAQMVLFLEECHGRNALYRDIKAENIIVGLDQYLKVVDFGFATYLPANGLIDKFWCGTSEYNAPEKVNKQPYGKPSDIWSLGVLLYVMLHDRFPFGKRGSPSKDTSTILFREDVEVESHDLFRRLCHEDPASRPSIDDIKRHPWLAEVDWDQFLDKQIDPPLIEKRLPKSSKAKEDQEESQGTQESQDLWKDW
jgi:protein kinase A